MNKIVDQDWQGKKVSQEDAWDEGIIFLLSKL